MVRAKPLPQASLEILLTLAGGEAHGYGIKRQVEERTEGAIRLGAGTLYAALDRLTEAGLIRELEERPDEELASSRWRFYAITDPGRATLVAELERLERIVRHARSLDSLQPEAR